VPKSAAVFPAVCRAPHPTALSPSLLHQGHDEENPEAPGCTGERSLFLLTKVHDVGTSLLAAAIASSERHCSASRGEGVNGSFSRMGLPSNGFSNNHWALSVSVTIPRRHSKQRPGSSYEGEESDQRFQLPKPFSDSFGRRCRLIGTALNAWQRRSLLRRFLCWALPPNG